MREVIELYGAGLTRIIAAIDDRVLADRLAAADDLVGSLLLVHGLAPHGVAERVAGPWMPCGSYLSSHGGDVRLLGVDNGVVRLAFSGSCRSCPSSAVTLELAVRDAVQAAAPEIRSVEAVAMQAGPVIPADALLSRVRTDRHQPTTWCAAPSWTGSARRGGRVRCR